jgi:hypothetical protein
VLARNARFLNGDQNEKKKRDPRLLEEEEGASAPFGDRPNQAAAADATPRATGEIRKATGYVDEIRTSRLVGRSMRSKTEAIIALRVDPDRLIPATNRKLRSRSRRF